MEKRNTEVLFLSPLHKPMIWGGNKLKEIFSDIKEDNIGESWVVSSLNEDQSEIINGIYKGSNLKDLYHTHHELFGHYPSIEFPLLIKFIDAKQNLSIQVHPDDKYAKEVENSLGKSESWLVLSDEKDSEMIIGHNYQNKEDFKQAIMNKTLEDGLNKLKIHRNDFFYIPAHTLHAICANTVIYEVQQNSKITYRIYDYGRKDKNGNERELHLNKALDVTSIPMQEIEYKRLEDKKNVLEECCDVEYFKIMSLECDGKVELKCTGYFNIIGCVEGSGTINGQAFKSGDHMIVPNGIKRCAVEGKCHLIISKPKAKTFSA